VRPRPPRARHHPAHPRRPPSASAHEPRVIDLPPGEAILLEALGSKAIITAPAAEFGVVLDLDGKLNKLTTREHHRFLLSPGQVAELIADLTHTLAQLPDDERDAAQRDLADAFERLGMPRP
jgi:hypothetical protein